ncbi:phage gp6-like head-tail connector protein [Enterobacter cloacae]|uniref:phage gp6-like head-tail connector protein n=1 Tax=Enterobacter cloacae TaxID=550 RepID=UPI002A8254E7|nr:phage gp6-like head-tail connector protein [Enterobacter cloacae]
MDERELSIIQAIGEEVRDIITAMKSQLEREMKSLVTDAVKAAVAEIPAPLVPELPDVTQLVTDAVKAAVAEIPAPVVPELPDVTKLVTDAVNAAVADIPAPAIPELPDVTQLVTDAVKAAVAEIPAPVVPELPDVTQLVADAVKAAVDEIPEPITPSDGRDALQIELEPCIDETKSYPRGTYATHKGGLWRSYQKTDGMRGWECIVDGVAGVNIQQDEERLFTISLEKASGLVEVKTFAIPVTIYRDVFKSGKEYEPGDTVTWAGSLWHCNEKTTDKPGEPGTKGWTLAVKKGRDLRDKP